jgi:hypothetical protein
VFALSLAFLSIPHILEPVSRVVVRFLLLLSAQR